MSDTSLTYDYVQTIVRDTINNSNGYISPLAFFTSVPAVQWVRGNDDKTSVINFVADKIHAEIISKTQDAFLIKDRRNIRNRMSESLDDYIEDLYKS